MPNRPRVYRCEGVILRRRNLGEADTIFTVYSPSEGKFDAIAKGVRKARSRMRGHLEPLSRSRLLLAKGRTLDVFTQAETIEPYRRVREDLGRGAAAIYCAELIDRFTEDSAPHPEVYGLLLDTLDALEAGAPGWLARWFELQLLAMLGFEVQVERCARCGGRLPERETLFVAGAGGLACPGCRPEAGAGRLVSVEAVKVLRFASRAAAGDFARLRLPGALAAELGTVLGDAVRYHLEAEPRSSRYVAEVGMLIAETSVPAPPT
ncbi:MAG: DNA repair protein RecO [Dehalococcoidia bacterium]